METPSAVCCAARALSLCSRCQRVVADAFGDSAPRLLYSVALVVFVIFVVFRHGCVALLYDQIVSADLSSMRSASKVVEGASAVVFCASGYAQNLSPLQRYDNTAGRYPHTRTPPCLVPRVTCFGLPQGRQCEIRWDRFYGGFVAETIVLCS